MASWGPFKIPHVISDGGASDQKLIIILWSKKNDDIVI